MTIEELARIVRSMRNAQSVYFRHKGAQDLNNARDWERRVDLAVKEILSPPAPRLFDCGPGARETNSND